MKYEIELKGDVLTIYSETHMNSGWFIDCVDKCVFILKEVPLYGGEPCEINKFDNIKDAFIYANKYLT